MPYALADAPAWTLGDYPKLVGNFKDEDDGAVIDLGGATVELIYWYNEGAATKVTAAITGDGSAGEASYTWTSPGLADKGLLFWQWRVTNASSQVFHSNTVFRKRVRRKKIA